MTASLRHGRDYHVGCVYTTKAACARARQEELGHCTHLTQDANECSHWAVDRGNDGKGYCNQHLASIVLADFKARRAAARKQSMDAAAERFIEKTRLHPSVWDRSGQG